MVTARLQVRAKQHRGVSGFAIIGTDTLGRRVSIFATKRTQADLIRDAVKAGDHDKIDALLIDGT